MNWLHPGQQSTGRDGSSPDAGAEPGERKSPGLAALFGALHGDGRHSILDLGQARGRHLRILGRFGRTIRFADLIPGTPDDPRWLEALRSLPPHPERPYDVVLLWDLLDRLPKCERETVVHRIADITAVGARLHAVVDATGASATAPLAFGLVDVDRVTQVATGPPRAGHQPILPAQVERDLAPFQILHAFTLRGGFREYVALKGP